MTEPSDDDLWETWCSKPTIGEGLRAVYEAGKAAAAPTLDGDLLARIEAELDGFQHIVFEGNDVIAEHPDVLAAALAPIIAAHVRERETAAAVNALREAAEALEGTPSRFMQGWLRARAAELDNRVDDERAGTDRYDLDSSERDDEPAGDTVDREERS